MSIPILVVKMPQIIPFPVYSQTGNGIITFWNWFWGHLDLRIKFRFHVHTHFDSRSWDMIYSFIILNTILFMAKFTTKTTTNSTTNIMLSLSLHPVTTTKKRNEDSSSHCWVIPLERGGTKVWQTHRQTDRHTYTSAIEATALRAWPKNKINWTQSSILDSYLVSSLIQLVCHRDTGTGSCFIELRIRWGEPKFDFGFPNQISQDWLLLSNNLRNSLTDELREAANRGSGYDGTR